MSTSGAFDFPPATLPDGAAGLRDDLRAFIAASSATDGWQPRSNFMSSFSVAFSRALGQQGWLGLTWPKAYGGQERSALERFVVTEELLAAGAPVAAHWVAERQSGPLLLRYGTEAQKQMLLPGIAAGDTYFSIGMSEPDSGSDLASIRTRAERTDKGWSITGTKVWTSNAHVNHWMILLARTAPQGKDRHAGLSQFLIDLKNDAITVNPIHNMLGHHEFNEVVLDETLIPADRLIGKEGQGWHQVTAELAYERSGPERFLSTYRVLFELVRGQESNTDAAGRRAIGKLAARLMALRTMSLSIAGMLERGENPDLAAAIVKDAGNTFEREVVEVARQVMPLEPAREAGNVGTYETLMAEMMLQLPSYTLRGGTPEIMRSIIARGLGVR